jgi:hypothetical protein
VFFFVEIPDCVGGVDVAEAWRAAFPGSATELRPTARPDGSGINSDKAARLLGWRAKRSWRDHLTTEGNPIIS